MEDPIDLAFAWQGSGKQTARSKRIMEDPIDLAFAWQGSGK
jgi:hypothetical protein